MGVEVKKKIKKDIDPESGYSIRELRNLIDEGTIGEVKKNLDELLALANSNSGRRIK